MIKKSILNPEYFEIIDEDTNEISYGCNQEWYNTVWQRLSGCGPTVATNIMMYFSQYNKEFDLIKKNRTKKNCVSLMEDIWKYVTPTMKGVNSTKIFYEGLFSYVQAKGINADYQFIDIPKQKLIRPDFNKLIKFIDESIENNSPAAFLNLCNGDEKCLDKWHWVTIVSTEHSEDVSSAFVEILDEGTIKKIDISLWYNTTTLGGGIVSFSFPKDSIFHN